MTFILTDEAVFIKVFLIKHDIINTGGVSLESPKGTRRVNVSYIESVRRTVTMLPSILTTRTGVPRST